MVKFIYLYGITDLSIYLFVNLQILDLLFSIIISNMMQQQHLQTSKKLSKSRIEVKQSSDNMYQYQLSNDLKINLSSLIEQLKRKGYIKREQIIKMLVLVTKTMGNEPNMIKLQSPINVVGDIHGQYFDLLNIFENFGNPSKKKYLFLGDYVDRGCFCIQVITLLIAYKLCYHDNIHLLRGNHQSRILGSNFNFKQQCVKKYDAQVYQYFMQFFDTLPLCCIIDKTYFAVHAGISPTFNLNTIQSLNRFNQIPNVGTICDLLWSDPTDDENLQWKYNVMRSCSIFYSPIHSHKFINDNNLKLIIRAHQVQKQGFKYQSSDKPFRNNLVLTVFSAPNYCDTYKNEGAIVEILKKEIKIKRFHSVKHPVVLTNYLNVIEWSLPLLANNIGNLVIAILKNRTKKRTVLVDKATIKRKIAQVEKIQLINSVIARKAQENAIIFQALEIRKSVQMSAEAALNLFMKLKNEDQSQKMPNLFGPKIHFINKVQQKSLNNYDDEPDFQKQNQFF